MARIGARRHDGYQDPEGGGDDTEADEGSLESNGSAESIGGEDVSSGGRMVQEPCVQVLVAGPHLHLRDMASLGTEEPQSLHTAHPSKPDR